MPHISDGQLRLANSFQSVTFALKLLDLERRWKEPIDRQAEI